MIHSLLSVVNVRILLCFAEILMALKAYRATERADFLPMFFFMFVFLLFAAKESVFMKNSRLLRGAETVLFALMTAAYAGYLPVLPVTLALGAGVAASLFRAPVSFDAENGEAFFNRDYRRFSTYASMLAGSLCGSVLSVETALAAMTALCAVRTLSSFFEKRQEPDMRFIGARRVISSFAQIRKYAVLCRASFGISWMWATGYLLLVNVDELADKNVLFENVLIFSAAFSFWGGCAYAKRLARQILDFTLSPLNTAGMTLCLSVLAVLSMYDGAAAKAVSLILWSGNAFCAGMYVLPLSLALRTRVRERNFQALVVTTKFLNLACFLIALILTAVRYRYGMPVGAIFAFCAVLGAGVLIYNCRISPASFQRALVRTVLVQFLFQRAVACGGQGVVFAEVVARDRRVFVKAQNVRRRDSVNDFGRRQSEHLFCENVVQPVVPVGIDRRQFRAVVQPFDDFRDVHSRFHIKVDERVVGIVKTSRVFGFQRVHHFPNDLFRSENLVVALRRNVIENVFRIRVVKVIRQLPL